MIAVLNQDPEVTDINCEKASAEQSRTELHIVSVAAKKIGLSTAVLQFLILKNV